MLNLVTVRYNFSKKYCRVATKVTDDLSQAFQLITAETKHTEVFICSVCGRVEEITWEHSSTGFWSLVPKPPFLIVP